MTHLMILTADALKALNPLERQAARRAARQQPLVQLIFRTFLERSGPIPMEDIIAESSPGQVETVPDALVALDEADVIRVRAGHIDIAYPFSAAATPFRLRLSGARERYACCALDALGSAPMIGERTEIRSQCHHCGEPVDLSVTTEGPGPEAAGVMVWFGKRADDGCKVADSL